MNEQSRRHAALDLTWHPSPRDGLALADQLALALDNLDIVAVQEFDTTWRVFFGSARARNRAARILDRHFRAAGVTVSAIDVDDEDWVRRSQADLTPVRVGRLIIAPPWSVVPPDTGIDSTVIRILPSMGFGTGHHATTRLCLQALQDIDLANRSFLDVGTGSGVLAIAACMLGARPVSAIDSDPDAVESARDNLRLNGVDDRVRLLTGDFRLGAHVGARMVAANLTGAALIQEGLNLAACVEPPGVLVVSGFLHDEAETVLSALGRAGDLMARYDEDDWCAATFHVLGEAGPRHD